MDYHDMTDEELLEKAKKLHKNPLVGICLLAVRIMNEKERPKLCIVRR